MWGDDNDEELLRALEESRKLYEEVEVPRLSQQVRAPSPNVRNDPQPRPSTSKAEDPFKKPFPSTPGKGEDVQDSDLYDGSEAEGFNFKTGQFWVYPTNDKYPVRAYQRAIVEKALFTNTLVSLPTGLGKTFIAAVVMYNYYMWYPKGKIIFMAPTKPLVAQQIENCINILGIPESDTAEMTGALTSKMRAVMWKEKRVFFLTPQCVQNDLTSNICPANAVKCVVIDEAHRALGDHAYAQVIRILNSYEARFRVLALSATPGSDLEAVQKVVTNLMISHIELRTEDSPDIVQYTHQRNLELMVVDVGPTINRIRVKFIGIATEYARSLQQQRLLFGNVGSMARFSVLKEWENFRQEGTKGMDPARINKANTDFALVHTFVQGIELLQTYGLRLLLNHIKSALNKGDAAANRLSVNDDLKSLIEEIDSYLNPIEIDAEEGKDTKKRFIYGHPKLDRLQEIVVSHFENFERKGEPTRTIVFCEYREGVMEICDMLKNFQPLVKPVAFMGQSVGKTSKGITQKQQLEIMEKFRRGVYNTLISTSVGEEGLDIGEVDLIICFDAKNSPIRQVQRMGRTGRKRQGKIIMLVTRGKEEVKYNQGLCKKKSVGSILLNKENLASHLLEESPSMLPPGIHPKYTERKVIQAPSKPKSNQQDLRKMFQKRTAASGGGTSKPSTVAKPHIGKMAFLSADEFADMKLVWDNIEDCCKFDKIPTRTEFWNKSADDIQNLQPEPSNLDLATYLEFMRFKQRTHVVGNSNDSLLLTKLLTWADDRRDSDQAAGYSSQITATQLWPTKSKKRGRPAASSADTKSNNPPKKRGRPKKSTPCVSPDKSNDTPASNSLFPQDKRHLKPLFIDDDECSPPTVNDSLQVEGPSTSVFLVPPPPLPAPVKTADTSTSTKSSVGDNSSVVLVDEITIESDEEDDLNLSSPSGFGYMSSQANQQDLYSELSRALKKLAPDEDEDECLICGALFPCDSLNAFVLQKEAKDNVTWKNIQKSLEEALSLVPQLTKEALSNYCKPMGQSQPVSLLPKYDFPEDDDEIFGGMLCGGMGDLFSQRLPPSSKMLSKSQISPKELQNGFKTEPAEVESFKMETDHVSFEEYNLSNEIPASSTPQKEQALKEERHEFKQETSFDFLGLDNIDDIFASQSFEKMDTLKNSPQNLKGADTAKISPKASKSPVNRGIWSEKNNEEDALISKFSPILSHESGTPTKDNSVASEQVSPILGSQVMKKPRPAIRLRKLTTLSKSLKSKDDDEVSNLPERDQNGFANEKHNLSCVEDDVSSSSQITSPQVSFHPPEVNFDLCDENFFDNSDEDSGHKSEIDDELKEAIRKRALEAKSRPVGPNFTQEMNEMCNSVDGLTQLMEMFDNKTNKSNNVQIERADSSSSVKLRSRSPSPSTQADGDLNEAKCINNDELSKSEEDIFAGCDDDSFFMRINSTEFKSPKRASLSKQCLSPLPFKESSPSSSVILQGRDHSRLLVGEKDDVKEEAIPSTDRSLSPVFVPSQNIRRPSKLSLKKKKSEVFKPMSEPKRIEDEAPPLKVQKPPEKCQSEVEMVPREKKQSDLTSQVDFSLYGDEFNNSWLLSQEKDTEIAIVNKANDKCEDKDIHLSTIGCNNPSVKKVAVGKEEDCQDRRTARDSSPENEFDVAFAKRDALRREQNKLFQGSTSTPNKLASTSKWFQKNHADLPSISKVQPSNSKLSWGNKLSRVSKLSTVHKNKKIFSSPSPVKNGWLTASKSRATKTEKSENNILNLSDFCDDSLLDVLESQKATVSPGEKPQTSLIAPPSKVKDQDDVIVLSSSDDESMIVPCKTKGKNRVHNISSSSEEGLLPGQTTCDATGKSMDSPLVKKRNRDALQTSSSSDSFVQKGGRKKIQKTEGPPVDTSDINNTLELSKFCDESLLNDILDDSHDVANVKKAPQLRRKPDFLSSSDEDDFVVKDKRPTKVNKDPKKEKKKAPKKKSKKAKGFIMSEAEESDDGKHNSSDGESTSLDELDSSFINDSQPEASQSVVDIHAKYLQSVKSPGLGRFKIPNRLPQMDMANVYSQYPDADELEQTYADDSFCVDDEPTQYEPEMSLLEIAEARLKAERKEKRKLKKALENGDPPPKRALESDESEEEVVVKKKRLKRIRVMEETMCEPVGISPVKSDGDAVPKAAAEIPVVKETANSEVNEWGDYGDLAQLLDDDLDFSAIPDPTPAVATKPPQAGAGPSNSKFVKKIPVLQSGGAPVQANPENGWKKPVNNHTLSKNLPSTSRQAAVSNAAQNSLPKAPLKSAGVVQAPRPSASVAPSESKPQPTAFMGKVFIIASSRQIAASPDLLRVLRVNYKITIVPHSVPDADFIVSWRLGVCRILSSELRDKKKLEELVKKLKLSYGKPHLIVENDRIKSLATAGFQKKGKKGSVPTTVAQPQTQSPWSATMSCANAALLRQAGVQLLFSQNFDETARFLAKLGMRETNSGHGIPEIAHNLSDEMEGRLAFFCSLPSVNYAFALKLLGNFTTLSEFLNRCSTVLNIVSNLGVDMNTAKRIFSVLSEAHM